MRRILVDAARARRYQKRGGGAQVVSLDEALDRVAGAEPGDRRPRRRAESAGGSRRAEEPGGRAAEFGGLSVEETAAALDVSPDTVMRDWRLARAWLLRELSGQPPDV